MKLIERLKKNLETNRELELYLKQERHEIFVKILFEANR